MEGVDKHRGHMYVQTHADILGGLILSGPVGTKSKRSDPFCAKPAKHTGLGNSVLQGPRRTDTARSAVTPHERKIRRLSSPTLT